LDAGVVRVMLEADAPRVNCGEHGPTVMAVAWARHGAGHTYAFDDQVAWLAVQSDRDPLRILARAYLNDDDEALAEACRRLPEREIRRAAALLSPFEDGLGSYYWLKVIVQIDELYLFFRRASFLLARGLDLEA
jgi:hypothetical protein